MTRTLDGVEGDARHVFHQILLASKFYLDALGRLAQEIATGTYQLRDFTITSLLSNPIYYQLFLDAAQSRNLDFSPYDTSIAKIERRWAELNFDARRAELLAQLPPGEFEHRLFEEVAFQARAYATKVSVIRGMWQQMATEEYEEFQQDDELADLEVFTLRDTVDLLLPMLPASEEKAELQEELAAADELLRREGALFFGPLLRMGSIQQMREAQFEPRERWWWYLDEIGQAQSWGLTSAWMKGQAR